MALRLEVVQEILLTGEFLFRTDVAPLLPGIVQQCLVVLVGFPEKVFRKVGYTFLDIPTLRYRDLADLAAIGLRPLMLGSLDSLSCKFLLLVPINFFNLSFGCRNYVTLARTKKIVGKCTYSFTRPRFRLASYRSLGRHRIVLRKIDHGPNYLGLGGTWLFLIGYYEKKRLAIEISETAQCRFSKLFKLTDSHTRGSSVEETKSPKEGV